MSNHKFRLLLVVAVIAFFLVAAISLLLSQLPEGNRGTAETTTSTQSIEVGRYSAVVYFKSKTCPACKLMDPVWAEVSAKYEGKVKAIVIVLNETTIPLFRMYEVRFVPTFIAFHNGEPVMRITGATSKSSLEALFKAALQG